ncbi:MAG: TAXI family TRAP transporter solute-binding subunit [Proteobacteria bacterium]|nr:TAXI family TRAP transporter solute-binding subunit [Pseudomonadota bacterium]
MKKTMLFLLVFVAIGSLTILPMAEAKAFRVKWGATSVRSSGYAHAVLFAKAVNQAYPGEISVTVVETGGWVENLSRMRIGLLKLAQVNPVSAYTVYNGLYDFKDQKNTNIRMLAATAISTFTFVAGKETGVTTLEGLNGIKMASNPLTTSERLARMLLEANDIKPVYKWGGTSSNLEAMKAKTVDAWGRPGWRDGGITELALSRPLNCLPVTDEHLKKYNAKFPAHGKSIISFGGQYKGQDKDYQTLAFVEGEMCDKDMPADVIYKILKAVYAKRAEMAKVDASFKEGGLVNFPKLSMEYLDVPLHPGAVKFYRELGMKIPESLLPPEMK